jgi:hypothetical protein
LNNGDIEHNLSMAAGQTESTTREPDVPAALSQFADASEEPEAKSELDQQVEAAVRDVESWFVSRPERHSSNHSQPQIDWSIPHLVQPVFDEQGIENPVEEPEPKYEDPAASLEERQIGDSLRQVETRMKDVADIRQQVESRLLVKLETEARMQAEASARRREEEELRRQAEEEATRRRQIDNLKLTAQRQEVIKTERELKNSWEEERRLRAEVVRLNQLAYEALLKRLREEEEAKQSLLAEAQRSRNEAEEIHVDSLAKLHSEEEYLRRAVARFSVRRTEVDAQRQNHEAESRKLEEEKRRVAAAESARLAERTRIRQEAEEKLRLEQQQLLSEENELARLTEALAQQRTELERARHNADEDARRLAEVRARMEAAQEKSQKAEAERLQLQAEIFSRAENERRLLEETRSRVEEQRQQLEASARERAELQARRLAEMESLRLSAESTIQVHLDREALLASELESLRQTEQATRQRIAELEAQSLAASDAHVRMLEKLKRVEDELQVRSSQEAQTRAEIERRIKEETEQLKRVEHEHKQRIDAEVARRAEAESRVVQEKNRYQTERDARIKVELRADLGDVTTDPIEVSNFEPLPVQFDQPEPAVPYSEVAFAQVNGREVPIYQVGDLSSADPRRRADAVTALARLGNDDAFNLIVDCFDDDSPLVRNATARALLTFEPDRPAESFTRALKDAADERKTRIGKAIAESGLATQALKDLCSQDREETYNGLCLLFTMARTGEVEPLVSAVENNDDAEVRLAAVRLLKMSGHEELAAEAVSRRLRPNRTI